MYSECSVHPTSWYNYSNNAVEIRERMTGASRRTARAERLSLLSSVPPPRRPLLSHSRSNSTHQLTLLCLARRMPIHPIASVCKLRRASNEMVITMLAPRVLARFGVRRPRHGLGAHLLDSKGENSVRCASRYHCTPSAISTVLAAGEFVRRPHLGRLYIQARVLTSRNPRICTAC